MPESESVVSELESKHGHNPRKRIRHRKKQLYADIMKQMEFYFSDANLTKDRFLGDLVKSDPFVPLEVFLKFNKIRSMTQDVNDILKAMKHSTLLEVSEDKTKVRRKTPVQQYNADLRTVYVESIPVTASREWLQSLFSDFGEVVYISLPKFKNSHKIKGYGFIEFSKTEDAQKCLNMFSELGCKLPTGMPPEELSSIKMFSIEEGNEEVTDNTTIMEEKATDNIKIKEEKATENIKITEEKATENIKIKEEKATDDVKIKEEKATDNVKIKEEIATDNMKIKEEKATEDVKIKEEKATDDVKIKEEKATDNVKIKEEIATDNMKIKEEKATEDVKIKEEKATDNIKIKEGKEDTEPPKKKRKKDKRAKHLELKLEHESDSEKRMDSSTPSTPVDAKPIEHTKDETTSQDENADESTPKKKNRKRTKERIKGQNKMNPHETSKVALWGLQVLSKTEWKSLRNKYLNLQRKYMKEVKRDLQNKRHGYAQIPAPAASADAEPVNPQTRETVKTLEPLERIPGVFVKEVLPEPCLDARLAKRTIRTNIHALHVEAKEGQSEVIIRFDSAKAADDYCLQSRSVARVVSGGEEEELWARAEAARRSTRRVRGRDRLRALQRAHAPPPSPSPGAATPAPPQPTHTHIRFDDE